MNGTGEKIRILCVDDEPGILEMYKRILVGKSDCLEGGVRDRLQKRKQSRSYSQNSTSNEPKSMESYVLFLAQSGEEAVEIVQREKALGNNIHIGCFDMVMPGMNGYDTIEAVLEIDPQTYCAIVTAHSDMGLEKLSRLFPSQDQWLFLNKPFGKIELLQVVRNLSSSWFMKKQQEVYAQTLEQEVQKRTSKHKEVAEHLIVLNELSREIAIAPEYDKLLDRIIEEIRQIIDAKMGSLLLVKEEKYLEVVGAAGLDAQKILFLKNRLDEDRISNKVFYSNHPLLIENIGSASNYNLDHEQLRPICHSLISVPVLVQGNAIGVLNFGASKSRKPFTRKECDLVSTLASQLGMVIENARLFKEVNHSYNSLRHSYLLTVIALTKAIDAKDHYTFGHSHRVEQYTKILAKQLRLGEEMLENLDWACKLHDIGKIAISETVLNKPGKLTEEEYKILQSHPGKGAEIISDIPFLEEIRSMVLHHHEHFDGKGYPMRIGGEEIPLCARIIAIADTYDAMTSDRPYRKKLSAQIAFDEIVACAGTQFDPEIVAVFVDCYRQRKL